MAIGPKVTMLNPLYICGMDIKNNILETIGNTPMIRLNKITRDFPCAGRCKSGLFQSG